MWSEFSISPVAASWRKTSSTRVSSDCNRGLPFWSLGHRRYNNVDRMAESSISCVSWRGGGSMTSQRESDILRWWMSHDPSNNAIRLYQSCSEGWCNADFTSVSCGEGTPCPWKRIFLFLIATIISPSFLSPFCCFPWISVD